MQQASSMSMSSNVWHDGWSLLELLCTLGMKPQAWLVKHVEVDTPRAADSSNSSSAFCLQSLESTQPPEWQRWWHCAHNAWSVGQTLIRWRSSIWHLELVHVGNLLRAFAPCSQSALICSLGCGHATATGPKAQAWWELPQNPHLCPH